MEDDEPCRPQRAHPARLLPLGRSLRTDALSSRRSKDDDKGGLRLVPSAPPVSVVDAVGHQLRDSLHRRQHVARQTDGCIGLRFVECFNQPVHAWIQKSSIQPSKRIVEPRERRPHRRRLRRGMPRAGFDPEYVINTANQRKKTRHRSTHCFFASVACLCPIQRVGRTCDHKAAGDASATRHEHAEELVSHSATVRAKPDAPLRVTSSLLQRCRPDLGATIRLHLDGSPRPLTWQRQPTAHDHDADQRR